MSFLCTYRRYKLKKFTKNSEKITPILSILPHRCIKFEVQIHYSLAITKKGF
jgi:hypothetical protein